MIGHLDLPPGSFDKVDVGDDLAFYAPPRLVNHIDEVAIESLTASIETCCRRAVTCST